MARSRLPLHNAIHNAVPFWDTVLLQSRHSFGGLADDMHTKKETTRETGLEEFFVVLF